MHTKKQRFEVNYVNFSKKTNFKLLVLVISNFLVLYLLIHNVTIIRKKSSKWISLEEEFDIITQPSHSLCDHMLHNPPTVPRFAFNTTRRNPNFWFDFTNPKLCYQFKTIGNQPMWSSAEEQAYPLAFSIMAFEGRQQFARLLRIIYRPHNVYCIHIDKKSSFAFRKSILDVAKCFGSNIHIVPYVQSTKVQWGYYSVLEPALTCAKVLLDYPDIYWKYLLNLNAKEFPILTNWELVKSIKALNGSNVAEYSTTKNYGAWIPAENFTFPLQWVKGYFLAVLRRDLVNFMFSNEKSLKILEVMQREKHLVRHPDEFLFPTLVYNPKLGVPGACYERHHPNDQDPRTTFVARYVQWTWDKGGCPSGHSRTSVCVFGVRDLHILSKRKEMFGNKFVYDFQPLALDCMEYWITKKLIAERTRNAVGSSFDEKFYSELYCSKNHAP